MHEIFSTANFGGSNFFFVLFRQLSEQFTRPANAFGMSHFIWVALTLWFHFIALRHVLHQFINITIITHTHLQRILKCAKQWNYYYDFAPGAAICPMLEFGWHLAKIQPFISQLAYLNVARQSKSISLLRFSGRSAHRIIKAWQVIEFGFEFWTSIIHCYQMITKAKKHVCVCKQCIDHFNW